MGVAPSGGGASGVGRGPVRWAWSAGGRGLWERVRPDGRGLKCGRGRGYGVMVAVGLPTAGACTEGHILYLCYFPSR